MKTKQKSNVPWTRSDLSHMIFAGLWLAYFAVIGGIEAVQWVIRIMKIKGWI